MAGRGFSADPTCVCVCVSVCVCECECVCVCVSVFLDFVSAFLRFCVSAFLRLCCCALVCLCVCVYVLKVPFSQGTPEGKPKPHCGPMPYLDTPMGDHL